MIVEWAPLIGESGWYFKSNDGLYSAVLFQRPDGKWAYQANTPFRSAGGDADSVDAAKQLAVVWLKRAFESRVERAKVWLLSRSEGQARDLGIYIE